MINARTIALFFLLFPVILHGQLQVSSAGPNSNPENLIRNVLAGPGVTIYNINSYGNARQYGYFTNGQDLGLDSGVVLSTGLAEAAASSYPLGGAEADFTFPPGAGQGAGDDDLTAIAQETAQKLGIASPPRTRDLASIGFEFEPEGSEVSFNFVFGSEEYPDFENTAFNDIFAFFVAGPGFKGPYTAPAGFPDSAQNIALVPGEDMAITVSTINSNRNSSLYRSNNGASISTHYNGLTTVINVQMELEPCARYYFRFAIADGTQENFDSGIFIQAGGFKSEKFQISKTASFQKQPDEFEEGCGIVNLRYDRVGRVDMEDSLRLTIDASSTANLQDISQLPDLLVFKPGERSKTVQFQILQDGVAEGVETLVINADLINGCLQPILTDFKINDYRNHILSNPGDETVNYACIGDSFRIGVRPTLGSGFYRYEWFENNLPLNTNSDSIFAYPVGQQTTYEVRVYDSCSTQYLSKLWTFNFSPASSVKAYVKEDTTLNCPGQNILLAPDSVVDGAAPFRYEWRDDSGVLSTQRQINYLVQEDNSLIFKVIDRCGAMSEDTIDIVISNSGISGLQPLFLDSLVCPGTQLSIGWTSSSTDNFTTQWGDGVSTISRQRNFTFTRDSTVTFSVIDKCGNEFDFEVKVNVNPLSADFEIFYDSAEPRIENYALGQQLSHEWLIDSVFYSNERTPFIRLNDYFDHVLTQIVRDVNGCQAKHSEIYGPPLPIYVPSAFTPDNDGINDVWAISAPALDKFRLVVLDRFGNEIFRTEDQYEHWNGVHKNYGRAVVGSYVALIIAERGTQRFEYRVNVNVIL